MNPYEALGVARDAAPATVKAAYRNLAKTAHPDTGGDRDAFEALQKAYAVLMDPERRAHYDATGEIMEKGPDNSQSAIMTCLTQAFEAAMQKAGKQGREPHQANMVEMMRDHLNLGIAARADENTKATEARTKWAAIRDRFHVPDGKPNVMASIIGARIAAVDDLIARHEAMDAEARGALEMLDGCEFEFDEPKMVSVKINPQARQMYYGNRLGGGWI